MDLEAHWHFAYNVRLSQFGLGFHIMFNRAVAHMTVDIGPVAILVWRIKRPKSGSGVRS